jgi:hypothetical protein
MGVLRQLGYGAAESAQMNRWQVLPTRWLRWQPQFYPCFPPHAWLRRSDGCPPDEASSFSDSNIPVKEDAARTSKAQESIRESPGPST